MLADSTRYSAYTISWTPDSRFVVWGGVAYDVWEQQLIAPETLPVPPPLPALINMGNLPEHRLAFWAPDGQRAVLFLTAGEIIIQESHSGFEGGEGVPLCVSSDVALWTATTLLPLGRIDHCLPDSMEWAHNGESALLNQFSQLPHNVAGWLLDFRRAEIVPLNQPDRIEFYLHGFGPSAQSVLYGFYRDGVGDQQLYLYDIVKQETREIAQPVHFVFDWFSDDKVLVTCYGGSLGSNHPLGIFPLAGGQCRPLGIDLAGERLGRAVLSPDKLCLAFTTVATDGLQGKLWLAAVQWGDEQN
ncbi:MAG: hypothetical protein KDE59_07090 [Anaerolineales bacterium]|nr:hypothetical protein [Anaerolineales bacterium]